MGNFEKTTIKDVEIFKKRLLAWAGRQDKCCLLESNKEHSLIEGDGKYGKYDTLVAIGSEKELTVMNEGDAFDKLKKFYEDCGGWVFGYFSYDLKNEIESLGSENKDNIKFPALQFFSPSTVCSVKGDRVTLFNHPLNRSPLKIDLLIEELLRQDIEKTLKDVECNVAPRITKKEYLEVVEKIKEHIRYGDIYEINYCQEFFAEEVVLDPLQLYFRLNEFSGTPFSCYYKDGSRHLACGSPERFLKKEGNKLISQPIKGTKPRGKNKVLDMQMKDALQSSTKEQSENVMIVDLVRNDLSKTAEKGSVKVDELCGVYSFKNMHQMISTISSKLKKEVHFIDAIKECFPMGSMTGAPKIRSMELIEKYEKTKRGLYSGAVGYIDPVGDFDFNVVIRSVLYNERNSYLSFIVGGAITDKSNPLEEYEECLLKAKPILMTLENLEFK